MNIDLKKLADEVGPLEMRFGSVRALLYKCEIPPVDCNECESPKEFDNKMSECAYCINNPHFENNFKQKQNELDKLFIGAPVMAKQPMISNEVWGLVTHEKDDCLMKGLYRLPTVKEAPRNVWLAPWLKMPEELNKLKVILINEAGDVYIHAFKWEHAVAVMILEEFKK